MNFLSLFFVLPLTQALRILEPSNNAVWDVRERHTIKWDYVNTDPKEISIYLVNNDQYPNIRVLLGSIETCKNQTSVQLYRKDDKPQTGYQINLERDQGPSKGILAQSERITIKGRSKHSYEGPVSGNVEKGKASVDDTQSTEHNDNVESVQSNESSSSAVNSQRPNFKFLLSLLALYFIVFV
ncbi:cell wall protein Pwp1 [Schizosaccharomyces japonicus yFS275]|uniref:Cell wall protein Pwp1 n=1 Tax=Schizosaccharomyces japonicus (strain yFS275 / FY16936) TaxID=402676 RepID=B6JXF9_SCHJY|nr:cell wall protein Pwp1 [Schizosaccharomyces japonicus yFS275]EEB06060.1 cell wall protein Pwp1 [Schizosaccharomyces japonicus yFS275]